MPDELRGLNCSGPFLRAYPFAHVSFRLLAPYLETAILASSLTPAGQIDNAFKSASSSGSLALFGWGK